MGGVSAVLYRLVVPARPVKMFASSPNLRGREYFHLFSGNFCRSLGADCSFPRTLIKELWRRKLFILVSSFKWAPLGPRGRGHREAVSKRGGAGAYIFTIFWGQKSISASKCPITSPQICTWSQKLSEFSYNTFKSLNGGHPRFWPRTLKITQIWPWEGGGRGWGGGGVSLQLILLTWPQAVRQMQGAGRGGGRGVTLDKRVMFALLPSAFSSPFHFSFASFWLAVRLFLDKKWDR